MYLNTKYIDVFKYFLNTFVNTFYIIKKNYYYYYSFNLSIIQSIIQSYYSFNLSIYL